MDLAELDTKQGSDEGREMILLHPATNLPVLQDDDKTPVTIKLAGIDSQRYRDVQREISDARIKSTRRTPLTTEELENDGIRILVACTMGSDGVIVSGETVDLSVPEQAWRFYRRFTWARDQVDRYIAQRANFLKASPGS